MDAAEIAIIRAVAKHANRDEWKIQGNCEDGFVVFMEPNIVIAEDLSLEVAQHIVNWQPSRSLSLIDALEQAQKERDRMRDRYNASVEAGTEAEKLLMRAQKDAKDARALAYEECAKLIEDHHIVYSSHGPNYLAPRRDGDREGIAYAVAIRARIEAVLEPQP
jgi:uncharacterized protein involved in copper resistance